jgi:dihydroorotase-like cyclic amidohydrolase
VRGWQQRSLAAGMPGDFTALDLETVRPVDSRQFLTKARFGPWEGKELKGWPRFTFVSGTRAFNRLGA